MGGPPQGPGYYPPPHPSLVGPGRGLQGPPQHAHMASSGDRRSPLLSPSPGSWNSLGSVASASSKPAGSHEGNVRGPPPPSSHPQQNNSGSGNTGSTGGNPLFSLQMLVNQDINRNAAAAGAVTQPNSYRASTPSAPVQQESVDLSPAGAGGDAYPRMPPQQSGPISLTRTDKQPPQVPEHLALRNGSIITSTSAVSNTSVTSPPTPLNGEVSSDSGIGSIPSSVAETPSSSAGAAAAAAILEVNKVKPAVDTKVLAKETVSVIAQTPPREKPKLSPVVPQQSAEVTPEDSDLEILPQEKDEDAVERSNPVIMSSTAGEPVSSSVSKQPDDVLSVPLPSPGSKDSTSPVRSPKSGNLKRTKKVDSILENLVESGTKKLGGPSPGPATASPPAPVTAAPGSSTASVVVEQPSTTSVVVAPASVIVSPIAVSEDSSSGQGREARTPSPVAQQKPITVHDEEAVSPTSGMGDDSENGKPRRKRKLDKPIRVSKVSGEGESEKDAAGTDGKDESQKSEEENIENNETKETTVVECPTSTTNVDQDVPTKPIESVTVEVVSSQDVVNKQEPVRRRRSSESSAASPPSSGWPVPGQRTRRKSASDHQQEDNSSSNGGDLLSFLVSDQTDKNSVGESKPEVKNAFIEVETELEKMFAGIVETESEECVDPLKLDPSSPMPMETSPTTKALDSLANIDSTNSETKSTSGIKSRGRPKGSRNGARRSSESIFGPSSTESTPKKKKKKQGKRMADDSPSSSQKKAKRTKLFHGENGNESPIPRKKGIIKGEASCRDGLSLYDSSSNTSSSRSRGPVIHIEGPRDNPYHVSVINAPSRGEDEDGGERGGSKKQPSSGGRRKNTSIHNDLEYRGT